MYIITKTEYGSSIVSVVDVKYDELEAIASFVQLVDSLSAGADTVIFISRCQAHIIKKNIGWISSSKDIEYVIQMIYYEEEKDQ